MSEVAKLRKEYEKLAKEYPLPEFEEFTLVFGFPKEEDFKSVLSLFRAVKKTPFNVANWIMNILSPVDTITSHDSHLIRELRDELLSAMKKCVVVDKRLSIHSFEASQSKDPEKVMAEALSEAVSELKGVAGFLETVLKKTAEGWEKEENDSGSTYHW